MTTTEPILTPRVIARLEPDTTIECWEQIDPPYNIKAWTYTNVHGDQHAAHNLPAALEIALNNSGWGTHRIFTDVELYERDRRQQCLWYAWGQFDHAGQSAPDDLHEWARRCGREAGEYREGDQRTHLSSIQDQFHNHYGRITR